MVATVVVGSISVGMMEIFIGFIGVITGFYNLRFQKVPHQSIFFHLEIIFIFIHLRL